MASITVRNIDDSLKARLRVRAAHHGRSMEEEARQILRLALREQPDRPNLADLAESLFGAHGAELEPHPRIPTREPPDLGSRSSCPASCDRVRPRQAIGRIRRAAIAASSACDFAPICPSMA